MNAHNRSLEKISWFSAGASYALDDDWVFDLDVIRVSSDRNGLVDDRPENDDDDAQRLVESAMSPVCPLKIVCGAWLLANKTVSPKTAMSTQTGTDRSPPAITPFSPRAPKIHACTSRYQAAYCGLALDRLFSYYSAAGHDSLYSFNILTTLEIGSIKGYPVIADII